MSLTPGQVTHGFECISQDHVAEINADAIQFIHKKTQAPVLILKCDDDNKVFCTYFRTPVDDNTGVPHILEHSVLNGSRKYPLKEPFLELIKASLYTFLNAMTYDDKTVYPVASRNKQDFHNLMDVYLDAVYFPNLSRETFMQEGWHYEVDDDRKIAYSGVVYNEMLGATSSPESILYDKLQTLLLPDSSYQYNSGGDPEDIPDLTYDQFINFHKSYYHPSNSKTVLYGDIDIGEQLAHLADYFDAFDYQDIDSSVTTAPRFTQPRSETVTYPVVPGGDNTGKSYVVRAWLLGEPRNREEGLAMEILNYILTGTQAAPLRRALIEAKLGDQTIQWHSTHTLDNYLIFGIKGSDEDKRDAIEATIDSTLTNLVKDGIPQRAIDAAVNTIEFNLREANFGSQPKGLIYALTSAETWLYDKDPLTPLNYEVALAAIKEKIANGGYFESLIKTYLLDNSHTLTLTMIPNEHQEAERLARLQQRLDAAQRSMTDADIDNLVKDCETLLSIQTTPDTPEALASIPKLPLESIDRQAEVLDFQIIDNDINLSFSEQPTQGIAYLKLHFNTDSLTGDELPYMPLLTQALLQTGTSTMDYIEFTQEIGIQTGGMGISVDTTPVYHDPELIIRYMQYNGKVLRDKLPNLLDLMAESLTDANLADETRIAELIRMNRSRMEASIKGNGSNYAITRAEAAISLAGRYNEVLGGIEQYRFLESLEAQLKSDPAAICAKLEELREKVVHSGALRIHLTGGTAECDTLQKSLPRLLSQLPSDRPSDPVIPVLPEITPDEGFIIPSKVQYVCKGLNVAETGVSYSGSSRVLRRLLSSDYLWNTVRVQGNAYGCFCNMAMLGGTFYTCSYRDPRLEETLEAYDAIADHLDTLDLTEDEFDKVVIGTMGKVDVPLSPSQKGSRAFAQYLNGLSQEDIQRQRNEILDCTQDDIRAYADLFRQFRDQGNICVFGSRTKLMEAASRFSTVIDLFAEE